MHHLALATHVPHSLTLAHPHSRTPAHSHTRPSPFLIPADILDPIAHPEHLEILQNDLVQMDDVTRMTVVDNLRRRLKANMIYTAVGDILIAINPYKMMNLYTPAVIDRFIKMDKVDCEPHVFGIAMNAFRALIADRKNQSILISGESGAGKTEATKQCLHLLSEVALSSTGDSELTGIENKILSANPVLEAFGNAKTVRNDNSSRFGKYMQVHFNDRQVIVGCSTTNYLLEKSRVVNPSAGERNFHVMYQLCIGAMEKYSHLGLSIPSYFSVLTKGNCTSMPHVDDGADFKELLEALTVLGFTEDEQEDIFSVVATVLHIGQVEFKESESGEGSAISEAESRDPTSRRRSSAVSTGDLSTLGLRMASSLLGVSDANLSECLTHRTVMNVKAELDVKTACSARDALSKELYGRLFNWIVLRINAATKTEIPGGGSHSSLQTIGILDIFGFEIFKVNSFEQLCINYANERLQMHFTNHTFDVEEELYKSEGIQFDTIEYVSNQDVIDLIASKKSLFNTLDDEVVTPRGSDIGFLNKCKTNFKTHAKFGTNFKAPTTFVVKHYAGDVSYEVDQFLEKNRDRMFDDLIQLMQSSTNKLLSVELFAGAVNAQAEERTSTGKFKTQSRKFADQLNDLVTMLNSTEPHYIRCIKPNPNKAPLEYIGTMVEEQLLYSGVFEATDIRKKGFPFRLSHLRFYRKFWLLVKSDVQSPTHVTNWKEACANLVQALSRQEGFEEIVHCQVGVNLVLWRVAQEHPLREARKRVEETAVLIMQCACRSANSRFKMKELAKVRTMYLLAAEKRDLQLALDAHAMALTIKFRNHYIIKLDRLKYCLETEKVLEEKFAKLVVNCTVQDVDEAFEKLVETGRDIGMSTKLFKQAEALYEQIAEKRACREMFRSAMASDDPDEVALKEALDRLAKLKAKYGEGMGLEEEKEAQELYDHIIKELELVEELIKALKASAFNPACLPTTIDDSDDLESSAKNLDGHNPRKAQSRELLSLHAFTSKVRLSVAAAVKLCSEVDLMEDGASSASPWEEFTKCSTDHEADEVLDMSSPAAQDVAASVKREIAQAKAVSESYHSVVNDIRGSLDEKPCPSEKNLRGAIMASESLEAKKLTSVPLTAQEVAHAHKKLERVLKEKELMANVKNALDVERLGPAETLPPGTSISTTMLDAATREANIFGITHPDDKKQLMHSLYMMRMRRTVKEVVVKYKRWRRSQGDDFVAANATVEALEGVLEERPRDLNEENSAEVNIGVDVTLRYSVVEEIVKRMDAASARWDEEALAHHMYQAERLNLESHENEEWRNSVKRAREVLATIEALREALERAIMSSDRSGLVEALDKAEEIGYDKPIVENAKTLLVKIDEVIDEASVAVWSLDREADMIPVVQRATNNSFNNDDVELLRMYISLPLDKFLGMQLEQAEKAGDIDMMVETWIRLHDIIFESAGNSYHFSNSRVLKSKDEFVGRRFDDPIPDARTRRRMDQMLHWAGEEIKVSMTNTKPRGDHVQHTSLAVLQFKNVMGYMGDRPSMYRDVFIDEVVRIGLEYPELQDETYCQLMKQLTKNPNRESSDRGWFLLETCVRKFPPSTDLSMYLESFIRDHGHGDLVATLSTTILKLGRHRATSGFAPVKSKVAKLLGAAGKMSGWLIKRAISQGGGKLSNNKKRFFVLNEDSISYYKTPENVSDEEILGSTKVKNIKRGYAANVTDLGDREAALFPFVVETTSGKVSLLCADSEELRTKWIESIQDARDKYWEDKDEEAESGLARKGGSSDAVANDSNSVVWREAIDKTTQRVYYYNTKTLETSWVRPHTGSVEVASSGHAAMVTPNGANAINSAFVGKHVMKPFDEEIYEGIVMEYFPANDGIPDLWRIKYSDGDEEDIEIFELEAAIKFYESGANNVEEAMSKLNV
jgi:myosin heavy subunit